MSDEPIEPQASKGMYVAEVIDLADVRIQWGIPKYKNGKKCPHKNLVYSEEDRRVWCQDCSRTIDSFDALMVVVKYFQKMESTARARLKTANEALQSAVRRRATKALDHAWSGQTMAVACPHCRGGLLPEDFVDGGFACTSREIEIARRAKNPAPPRRW